MMPKQVMVDLAYIYDLLDKAGYNKPCEDYNCEVEVTKPKKKKKRKVKAKVIKPKVVPEVVVKKLKRKVIF